MSIPAFVSRVVPACLFWLALVLGHERAIAQAGGIRGPSTVTQGGTIEVDVASGDGSVEVNTGGPGTASYPVPPGKKVSIPVPPVPGGTVLVVSVGRGLRARFLLIEVIAP